MKQIYYLTLFTFTLLFTLNISAQDDNIKENKLKLYGDVRFRVEADRNSNKNTIDIKRADRDRLRYRARFGFNYKLDNYEFGVRLTSGNPANQQSPHTTLGNGFDSHQFSLDKAYIKVKSNNGLWAWVGKNTMPFWGQNELLWDGDVNPEGVSLGGKFNIGEKTKLTPILGYYITKNNQLGDNINIATGDPINNLTQTFNNHSNILLAQLKACSQIDKNKLSISSGLISSTDKGVLKDKTDDMKYTIWASSIHFKSNIGLTAGFDYFNNLVDYTDNAAVIALHKNQKTGYVASLKYGKNKFTTAVTYALIQKYAVVDLFAQDDWVRWGTADMTRSSNFKGFELNFKYKFTKYFNSTLRFWNVEGIKFHGAGNQLETGTRVRLDFNIKF